MVVPPESADFGKTLVCNRAISSSVWSPVLTLFNRSPKTLSSPCLWFSTRVTTVNSFHKFLRVNASACSLLVGSLKTYLAFTGSSW